MSKLVCVKFASLSAAAFLLLACGTDKPAIPPVAPVVQPMQEEGLFGDDSAGETTLEDEAEGTSGSATSSESDSASSADKSAETEKSPYKASSDAGAASASDDKAEETKSKSRTKYKSKQP
ncbi:MAG TPA: hypothetical protein VI072_20455 [Polyangiaceae bacterium]